MFEINYVVVKIIGSIFNVNLFDFSHFISLPNLRFFVSTKFNARNIIFNQRPIVINKINSNSSKNCKKYYHQYNIHCARTTFITIFIFSNYFLLLQQFQYIHQIIYQLIFFCIYNFHSLNIH